MDEYACENGYFTDDIAYCDMVPERLIRTPNCDRLSNMTYMSSLDVNSTEFQVNLTMLPRSQCGFMVESLFLEINVTHQWPVDLYYQHNATGITYDNSSNLVWSGDFNRTRNTTFGENTTDCFAEKCTTPFKLKYGQNYSFYMVNWDRWDP